GPLPATPTPQSAPSALRPCGVAASPPARYQHVVWIVMENRGYREVVGSPSAPYLNRLAAACGLATNYWAVAHPSLPNYIALTSGSTQGISNDNSPQAEPVAAPSLFSLLGRDWRALEEGMPYRCDRSNSATYATKHNPAVYYTRIAAACARQDRPLSWPPPISARFTFITPDLCHDMHDCSTATGDAWLARVMPALLDSPQYRAGETAIFITWDEGTAASQRVATYVVAPSVPSGARPSTRYTHYSLLRTTEELLGIGRLLGGAATATSMRPGFHL
ncbi:MAG TPA: alkaline phosphatase family protein, partial [Candidatus Dormibacteraeota bacterium]|nr:alkaline phosphatase family protein [Candidatus Dormibacteraeota bacterium]